VLQSSANRAGGPDPRRIEDVPELIRAAADLVLDGGELAGTPSTVLDLTRYEEHGEWTVVRHGAVSEHELGRALVGQFHFDPASYADWIRADLPSYDRLQDEVAIASGDGEVRRILDLGVGTGETARRVLARHPGARLVGIDESSAMVSAARGSLEGSAELRVGMLEDALPPGPFDLVVSALAVHHLDDAGKADLFRRVGAALAPQGVFVLGDVVVPARDEDRVASLTPGYDRPSPLPDLLGWLTDAGFEAEVCWEHADLAVLRGRKAATPTAIVADR
jgi:tRNA (cmo5U34)-methyltransferase